MMMASGLTARPTLRALLYCRDLTCWLEGAGPARVDVALLELEATPVEAVVAAVTFVGIRRRILAERRGSFGQDRDLTDLRASLTVTARAEDGLADGCLGLIALEDADQPLDAMAERLYRTHGLQPVLAMASFAKALGQLLVGPPYGFPTYDELYLSELAWMSGPPHPDGPGTTPPPPGPFAVRGVVVGGDEGRR